MFKNYKNTPFESHILPAIPPKATLSEHSSVHPDQLGKIPGKRNQEGVWTGFPNWSNHKTRQLELDVWSMWKANVCLRAGQKFVFIDIDIEDPELVAQLHEYCINMLGAAPVRSRTGSYRILLPFAQADHISKQALKFVHTDDGRTIGIDVLGDGSQAAIHGLHPKGGEYVWDVNLYEYGELTQITSQRLEAFLRASISFLEKKGFKLTSGGAVSGKAVNANVEQRVVSDVSFNVDMLPLNSALKHLIVHGPAVGEDRSSAIAKVIAQLIKLGMSDNQIADVLLNSEYKISQKCLEKGEDWVMTDIARLRAKKKDGGKDGQDSTPTNSQAATVDVDGDEGVDTDDLLRNVENLTIDADRDTIAAIIDKITLIKDSILIAQLLNKVAVNSGLGKRAINKAFKDANRVRGNDGSEGSDSDDESAKSHKELANELIVRKASEGSEIVNVFGHTYIFNPETGLWDQKIMETMPNWVADEIPKQQNFMRGSDYSVVAKLVANHRIDDTFFDYDRDGFVGDDGMVYSADGQCRALSKEDRARHTLLCHPEAGTATAWEAFLERALAGPHLDTQYKLLQELMGATLVGLLPRMQTAVMLIGQGRTGKSTIAEVMEGMFPAHARSSIAPYDLDKEYYRAGLATSLYNFMNDLDSERKIASGPLKEVLDRSAITARHPAGRTFQFVCQASMWCATNDTPFTNDVSNAFARRWKMIVANNQIPENEVIHNFSQVLLETEGKQIMHWMMVGAKRVIEQNGFTDCPVSNARKGEWMQDSNSVLMFLHDDEVLEPNPLTKVAYQDLFEIYKAWCKQSNYRPYGKRKFYQMVGDQGHTYERDRTKFYVGYTFHDSVFSRLGVFKADLYGTTAWDELAKCGPLKAE